MTVTVLEALVSVCSLGAVIGFVLGVAFAGLVLGRALRSKHGDHVLRVAMFVRNTRARAASAKGVPHAAGD